MNPKINLGVHFHNKFELKLIDAVTGTVKQKAYAKNVVLDRFWTFIGSGSTLFMHSIVLGTGSGTPSSADTGLFSYAFGIAASTVVETVRAYPTSHITKSATFPATSSYVANLTEVGLTIGSNNNNQTFTHAMLTDAENNTITINKTELDILIVTATVYCTIISSVSNFYLTPPSANRILNWMLADGIGPFWPQTDATGLSLLTSSVPGDNNIQNAYTQGLQPGVANGSSWNAATKTLTIVSKRIGTGAGNTRYYHGLALAGQGHVQFPNTAVFPNYEITGIAVGTGDGTTAAFKVPIPLFVQNTDKIYKNGVQLVRGTDYTIENNSNPDMLCNIAPGNFATFTPYAGSKVVYGTSSPRLYAPLICDSVIIEQPGHGAVPTTFAFDPEHPAVFQLAYVDNTIGKKCNYFRVGSLRCRATSTGIDWPSPAGLVLTLEYSNDALTWVEAGSIVVTTTYIRDPYGTLYFDAVEATYWRLSMDATNAHGAWRNYATYYSIDSGASHMISLGYTNPTGLVFTTPPASGDIITMDCTIDRPYKNENFVIDTSMTVQLS